MLVSVEASILLCTRNRSGDLEKTLQSLTASVREQSIPLEIVVIDNGSTDDTGTVAASKLGDLGRCVLEPKAGLSNARNRALREAKGDVLVFLDDDVETNPSWLPALLKPISEGLQAVSGSVKMGKDLVRPWMTERHRVMFAETMPIPADGKVLLTGANMAFSRDVLKKVPAFDPELGAGALGFCEETLFSEQLLHAGFKIGRAEESRVIHWFQPDRLQRASMLKAAHNLGKSLAYMRYHWSHDEEEVPFAARARMMAKQKLEGLLKNKGDEGADVNEIDRATAQGYHAQLQIEKQKPRHYEKRGLTKIG